MVHLVLWEKIYYLLTVASIRAQVTLEWEHQENGENSDDLENARSGNLREEKPEPLMAAGYGSLADPRDHDVLVATHRTLRKRRGIIGERPWA